MNFHKREIIAFNKGYRVTKQGEVIGIKKRELKQRSIEDRLYIGLRIKGITRSVKTHRLQAYQKFGNKIFEEGIVVRHLNGNSLDNSWDNIAIGTASDNQMDIPKQIRIKKASKANNKYPHDQIIRDKSLGMSYRNIMIKYNIPSKGTVSYIINKSLKSK